MNGSCERDRAQAGAQAAQVGEERPAVEQRWEEQQEHQLRLELDLRQPRDEAHREAADHEHDRIRDIHRPRRRREHDNRYEQADED
jgi:hypothetical protein